MILSKFSMYWTVKYGIKVVNSKLSLKLVLSLILYVKGQKTGVV